MTEGTGLEGAASSSPSTGSAAPVSAPSAPAERTFSQAEVNELVGQEKKALRERMQSEQPAPRVEAPHAPSAPISDDYVKKLAADVIQSSRDEWLRDAQMKQTEAAAGQVVEKFFGSMNTGKEKYSDFETVTNDLEYKNFPRLIGALANGVDNIADVMYHLSKDPIKLSQWELALQHSNASSMRALQSLSNSIKENEAALNKRQPNAPIGKIQAGNAGLASGERSISDLRRDPRYRC